MPRVREDLARRTGKQEGAASARPCDRPGCEASGEFRAPKSRRPEDGHLWFCLDHVREYNAAWDFFAGMTQPEIEEYQRNNSTWHRPTWRLGVRQGGGEGPRWVDPFDFMMEAGIGPKSGNGREPTPRPLPREEREALAELELNSATTLSEIKSRYKQLVKRFHPDANGGDKDAEERFKRINKAYTYLMSCGYT